MSATSHGSHTGSNVGDAHDLDQLLLHILLCVIALLRQCLEDVQYVRVSDPVTLPPPTPSSFFLIDIFGAAEAIIVDTDYWQYAVLVECQSVMYFMKRTSASILSRRRDLDLRVLSQVKRDLCDSYGFDCSDFEAIDHNRCASTKREVVKKIEARASPLSNPKPLRRFPMPEVARTTPSTKTNMRTFRPVTQKPTSAPVTPRVYLDSRCSKPFVLPCYLERRYALAYAEVPLHLFIPDYSSGFT
ncbi:uncharacterized protein LOC122263861 [Penaeus japonicus]|uniref:uncharacterized protein LOC122263861 n=1 Tax=Penaeus japonicus TaxID=27405 RepID=UPI001C7140A1|nr:uncharacterized protein LOC122263861 [Penaeus japonicus]